MRALLVMALVLAGCADAFDAFGGDDATSITIDADIPALMRLPPEALPASPVPVHATITVPVPMDLVGRLREQGRNEDADLLENEKDRIESVELERVEYEVADPNRLPVAIGAVAVDLAPLGATTFGGSGASPLGWTVPVPPERAIATRELRYAAGGLDAASDYLRSLRFTLLARTDLSVEPGRPIPANALALQLNFRVKVTLSLTK